MPRGRPRSTTTAPEPEVPVQDVPPVEDVPLNDIDERPIPESELTPEQRRIRDLENQLAVERGKKDPEVELEKPRKAGAPGNICIHFVEDGLSALGHIWVRGQELEFDPKGQAYKDTCDRNGNSWLDLVDDDSAQMERWGSVKFRRGPWPGKRLTDVKVQFEQLKSLTKDGVRVPPPTEAELEAAVKAEAKRGRAAPRLPRV